MTCISLRDVIGVTEEMAARKNEIPGAEVPIIGFNLHHIIRKNNYWKSKVVKFTGGHQGSVFNFWIQKIRETVQAKGTEINI